VTSISPPTERNVALFAVGLTAAGCLVVGATEVDGTVVVDRSVGSSSADRMVDVGAVVVDTGDVERLDVGESSVVVGDTTASNRPPS
jgi:hypothetical protein